MYRFEKQLKNIRIKNLKTAQESFSEQVDNGFAISVCGFHVRCFAFSRFNLWIFNGVHRLRGILL